MKHILYQMDKCSEPAVQILDDQQTPLYDLVSILEEKTGTRHLEDEKLIMVETEGQIVGMIVSSVDQVVTVDANLIKPISPIFKGISMSCFPNVLKHDDTLILLVAPNGIRNIVRRTGKKQNSTNTSEFKDVHPEADDTIVLMNEGSNDSNHGPISLVDRWAQGSDMYELLQDKINPENRRSAKDVKVADMTPEIIDASEIEDESHCESASFLTNFLQSSGEPNEH